MQQNYDTKRLYLQILTKEYAPMVLAFYQNNDAYFSYWEPARSTNFYSLTFQETNLNLELELMNTNHLLRLYLFRKENPCEIIGCISFQNIQKGPYKSCILGYKLDKRYTGQGYAFEAVKKGIQIMFEEKKLHRIEALIHPMNIKSLHVISTLGFEFEGIAKSSIYINKKWTDHLRYALINPLA